MIARDEVGAEAGTNVGEVVEAPVHLAHDVHGAPAASIWGGGVPVDVARQLTGDFYRRLLAHELTHVVQQTGGQEQRVDAEVVGELGVEGGGEHPVLDRAQVLVGGPVGGGELHQLLTDGSHPVVESGEALLEQISKHEQRERELYERVRRLEKESTEPGFASSPPATDAATIPRGERRPAPADGPRVLDAERRTAMGVAARRRVS